MKKIFLGSAALLLSAGVASAQISLTGDGRMGVVFDDRFVLNTDADGVATEAESRTQFSQRYRVQFNASGTTDTGLTFGGFARVQFGGNTVNATGGSVAAGQQLFISSAFGRIEMGDVSGAVESAVGDLHGVGYAGIGFENENQFIVRRFNDGVARDLGDTGPGVRYSYSFGDASIFANVSQIEPDTQGRSYGLGAAYSFEGFRIGGGIERLNTPSGSAFGNFNHAAVALGYSFDIFEVRATYGRVDSSAVDEGLLSRRDQFGISGAVNFDDIGVTAFYRRDFEDLLHVGVGASYDLGGGAVVRTGLVRSTRYAGEVRPNRTRADFGINLSF